MHSHLANVCDDMAFASKLSLFSFILVLLCFCVLLLFRTVCACAVFFFSQRTNAYLIATILTDMEQIVMIEFLTVTVKPD